MSTSKPPVHDAPDVSQHDRELFHRLRTLDDMIRASEEAEDKYRAVAERRRIPPLPNLRFEYSYLRGVAQYVRLERPQSEKTSEKGKEKAAVVRRALKIEKVSPSLGLALFLSFLLFPHAGVYYTMPCQS